MNDQDTLQRDAMIKGGHELDAPARDDGIASTEPVPDKHKASSFNWQDWVDRALRFISTARSETLGACVAGLGACTYVILGRVGLVLIGVVGGVALHASWENGAGRHFDTSGTAVGVNRRKEQGLDIIYRVLSWRLQNAKDKRATDVEDDYLDVRPYSGTALDFSSFEPQTAAALTSLTDTVIRDYVTWWYSPMLPIEFSFPAVCRQTFAAFVVSLSSHISRRRAADTFLDFLTNSSSIVVVFLNELSSALTASPMASPVDAIQTYLTHKPKSHLANIIDISQQQNKLKLVAEDILQSYLEPKTYNCQPARVFLREILAKVIIARTIESCSRAEWINEWIVYLLEEERPELVDAINIGFNASPAGDLKDVQDRLSDQSRNILEAPNEMPEQTNTSRQRRLSKAEQAMDDAMREAKRLSEMIAAEEKRSRASASDEASVSTTQDIQTPRSSQDGQTVEPESRMSFSEDSQITGRSPANPTTAATSRIGLDEFLPSQAPTASLDGPERPHEEQAAGLTLYNAKIVLFDDSIPGDKSSAKNKPTSDYIIQIEPASARHPGWMITRRYADFETLHEVLRRISVVSGIGFSETHRNLPNWRTHSKASLTQEVERYLHDALCFRALAESEGMRRFLEKDQGVARLSGVSKASIPGLGWPSPSAFEAMGKGMIDVLTKAPREVAGGGKALISGVGGVLGGGSSAMLRKPPLPKRPTNQSLSILSRVDSNALTSVSPSRLSLDSGRSSPFVDTQPARILQMDRRPSRDPSEDGTRGSPRPSVSSRSSNYARSRNNSRPSSTSHTAESSPSRIPGEVFMDFNLPPLPTDIADDYDARATSPAVPREQHAALGGRPNSLDASLPSRLPKTTNVTTTPEASLPTGIARRDRQRRPKSPMTEREAQTAVELFFGVITELYTSSAWNFRRTLLAAAKTFLLRPGSPQLESIRLLLQDTVIDANTSDSAIATHLRKLRENALPTEEEFKAWPPPPSEAGKEMLRKKARMLLLERGMPQALTSVMGAAATGEALGKVFDCLQVEEVARGLMFGLMLQAIRAFTQ